MEEQIFKFVALFCLIGMVYNAYGSKYKIDWTIWLKSFLLGFVGFSVLITILFTLPLALLFPFDPEDRQLFDIMGMFFFVLVILRWRSIVILWPFERAVEA